MRVVLGSLRPSARAAISPSSAPAAARGAAARSRRRRRGASGAPSAAPSRGRAASRASRRGSRRRANASNGTPSDGSIAAGGVDQSHHADADEFASSTVRRHAVRQPRRQRLDESDVLQDQLVARRRCPAFRPSVRRIAAPPARGSTPATRIGDRRRRQAQRRAAARVRPDDARREDAEAAARRRLRQVLDERALPEHRLADRGILDDEAVVAQAAIEEARRRDVELAEHERRLFGVARRVDDDADLLVGRRRRSES